MTSSTRPRAVEVPWPTPEQLARMGLERCGTDGCATFVDPVNLPGGHCIAHARQRRQERRQRRLLRHAR